MEGFKWLFLIIVILSQFWAVRSVMMDHRFDALTRMSYSMLVILLPIVGFFIVHRLREKALYERRNDRQAIRDRLRGRIGRL